MVSGLGLPLGYLLDSHPGTFYSIQLFMDSPPASKVRYHGLLGYSLRDTLAEDPAVSGVKLLPHPSGTCPNSPLQATLAVPIYGA